jgi:hypothetical protein
MKVQREKSKASIVEERAGLAVKFGRSMIVSARSTKKAPLRGAFALRISPTG